MLLRATSPNHQPLTAEAEIEEHVRKARPLSGGLIPQDFAQRLGATHYDGHYFLTDKPYLIEGAEAIQRLGMRSAKFWLCEGNLSGYGYNSDWKLSSDARLVDALKHPYYVEALAQPFTTVVFEIYPLSRTKESYLDIKSDFAEEEHQFFEIALYLLKTYSQRSINFIFQNWEGDWMLRGQEGAQWGRLSTTELNHRCQGFIRWLAARQSGVERARKECGLTRCKVYNAAEVNRVWDSQKGLPTLMTHVLPLVELDLVSWSSYDGMASASKTWQGIEMIRNHIRPSSAFGKPVVYIGEIGKPENEATEKEVVEWWDRAMGVFLAMDIPWIIHWELYCNEPKDKKKWDHRPRTADELRGFWLVRPDGSLSHSAKYLTRLLKSAGGRLPAEYAQIDKSRP